MIAPKEPFSEPEEPDEPDGTGSGDTPPGRQSLEPARVEPGDYAADIRGRKDLNIISMADRLKWNISDRVMDKVRKSVERIIDSPESQKIELGACKLAASLVASDIAFEKMKMESKASESPENRSTVVVMIPNNGRDPTLVKMESR